MRSDHQNQGSQCERAADRERKAQTQSLGQQADLEQAKHVTELLERARCSHCCAKLAAARPAADQCIGIGPHDSDPATRRAFARATAEGYRQGADAPTKDGIVFGGAWGFEAHQLTFERVLLGQGQADRVMPPAAAHLLCEALLRCDSTFFPDEGSHVHLREPRSGNLEGLDRLARAASYSARARFDESSVGGELRR
jgi:hypothetical protein